MGALLAIILSAGFPPADDGGGCEAWTATRAGELASAPQPVAAQLGLSDVPGLADLDQRIWATFSWEVPTFTTENTERFAAALDGRAPISTAPELVAAARKLDAELGKLLVAARGSRNRLPDSLQIWSVFDGKQSPTTLDVQAAVRLSLARGRDALRARNLPRAVEACIGILGLLRASAGSSLLGRMISASLSRRTRDYCLTTAERATPQQHIELQLAITGLKTGWPSQAHTLEQELVFAQVGFYSAYWSAENRSRLPKEALHLNQAAAGHQQGEASWSGSLRRALFGRWSAREQCLLYARALPQVDSAPQVADPALRGMDEVPLFGRLADWDDLRSSPDHWVSFFRRLRALETDLALLRAGFALWVHTDRNWVGPRSLPTLGEFTDARTGRPLRLEATDGYAALVAEGDPANAAPEIRVQLTQRE